MVRIKKKSKLFEYLCLAVIGGETYVTIEVFFRNYSHWSMFICGMLCFLGIDFINQVFPWAPLWLQMIIGGFAVVTPLEFITGWIVNIKLGWNVWNYTDPFNFMGQISLPSSIAWCFLSLLAILLDGYLRYWFFGADRPRYKMF